jgi:hypothetical protein
MTIVRKQGKWVASLRPKDIGSIYHIPTPKFSLNEPFLKKKSQPRKVPTKKMKHWWVQEDETIKQGQKLVPTHRLNTPYKFLVAMLY